MISLIDRGTGSGGNPALLPFESENFDISAEYYYGDISYFSVGYFTKDVDNWITQGNIDVAPFNVGHPGQGPRYTEAAAAVGSTDANAIRDWIIANYPATTAVDPNGLTVINGITGEDPREIPFMLSEALYIYNTNINTTINCYFDGNNYILYKDEDYSDLTTFCIVWGIFFLIWCGMIFSMREKNNSNKNNQEVTPP